MNMIEDIKKNGKTLTWFEYAEKYKIKEGYSRSKREKAACDKWRYYKKTSGSNVAFPVKAKLLIYDVETTLLRAEVWNTGKTYIRHDQLMDETQFITIAYKWLGDDQVHCITWDNKNKNDKQLVKEFLKVYNSADAVIGVNNNSFDNKLVNARAAKYDFDVNTKIKSIDVMRQAKKAFKLPSYSMKYMCKFFGLTLKLSHAGIQMWRDIQWGDKKASKKALKEMVEYNIGDINSTEDLYYKIRKYSSSPLHIGVLENNDKLSCPDTGSKDIKLYKETTTAAGSKQYIMKSKETGKLFTFSATDYKKWNNE